MAKFLPSAITSGAHDGRTHSSTPSTSGGKTARPPEYQQVYHNAYFFPGPTAYEPNRYYLELFDGVDTQKRIDAVECPLVNGVQGSMPSAVERTWTIESLYEEHRGFRQREFVLTGRSGFTELHLLRFYKFRNFIEKYQLLSSENKNAFIRGRDIRLVLNFPFEGENFYCTLTEFNYTREVQTTRVSYAWQIRLVTYGTATRQWQVPSTWKDALDIDHLDEFHPCNRLARSASDNAPPEEKALFKDLNEALNTAAKTNPSSPDDMRKLGKTAKEAGEKIYEKWDDADPAVRDDARSSGRLIHITGLLSEFGMQAQANLGYRFESVDIGLGVALDNEGHPTITGGASAGPASFMFAADGAGNFNATGRAGVGPAAAGFYVDSDGNYQVSASVTIGPAEIGFTAVGSRRTVPFSPSPVVSVTVSDGDGSLADIAQRETGSRNNWPAILRLNGWMDARTRRDGSPIAPGMVVLVPAPVGTPKPSGDDLYGTDLALDRGDLVLVGTTDVAAVGGLENLRANIGDRMLTDRGTNRAFPGFGLEGRIGESATSDIAGLIMSDVRGQAAADHRITRVTYLNVLHEADTLTVRLEVEAVTRARATLSFPYPGVL